MFLLFAHRALFWLFRIYMLTLREKNLTYPKMGWHICFKGIFSFFWGVMFFYFFVWMRKQVSKQPGRVLQAREPGSVRKGVCPPGKLENGKKVGTNGKLGGGFKDLLFSPLFGDDFHFDEHIFQLGWKPPTRKMSKRIWTLQNDRHILKGDRHLLFTPTGVFGDLLGMKYLVKS